ncbi:MAG: hypothetical protein FJ242_09360 [Nitrospira sp.]|nr:hypothetical protein [Nitrospira sp.]
MGIDIDSLLEKITTLSSFSEVFSELKKVDQKKGDEIKKALNECVKDIHLQIQNSKGDFKNLKYLLYKESVEVKAHSSSYLSYSEMMAVRENALWKFAFNLTEQFFDIISNALDDYFRAKAEIINQELEQDATWYSGLRDTTKKMGSILNISKKLVKEGLETVGLSMVMDDKELVDTHGIVEKLLDKHLSPKEVSKDIAKIMKKAHKQYKGSWEKEIKIQAPDLSKIKAFASMYGKKLPISIGFELGAAEQTFAVGISGAIAGTIGLAAGWHTLTYALLHVFPPVAIFAILGTVVVAVLTKDKALEKRKTHVKEAVKQYHRHFLLQIEVEKLQQLNNKTLREAMIEQSKNIVQETVKQWGQAISGNLTVDHYRLLVAAFTKHLILIDDCLHAIEEI